MYASHFGLRERPFSLTPDPDYLYLGPGHQEALAHLLYGLRENGGFVLLTGEIGTGKTTLIRALLQQCPADVDIALCLNPRLDPDEFLATLLDELGIPAARETGFKARVDALNRHLLQAHGAGRRTVVILDEAQQLSPAVLEQIRLLTNLETARHKLLRMVLVGQPELRELLARPGLRQLDQRITARCHLAPLDRRQSRDYLRHRLAVAGGRPDLFRAAALRLIHRRAHGLPRLLNVIADRALLGAYARDRARVGPGIARRAAREVLQGANPPRRWPRRLALAGLPLIALTAAGFWQPPPWREIPDAAPEPEPAVARTAVPPPVEAPPPTVPPEPAPPAATPPPAPSLTGRLDRLTRVDALAQLLALWQMPAALATVADPCAALAGQGLRCLQEQADWATLRRYDRPALLTLAATGGERRVLLRRLDGDRATLLLDDAPVEVSREALESVWTGELLLLWRPPVAVGLLQRGSRGEAVRWLRQRLALATGHAADPGPQDRFDVGLERQVRRFQQQAGLQVDGLVGSRTLLLLHNLAPPPATPRLEAS
ncbi:MAG: AAA family ATPase [Candidatus Competibacterales bacterium]|nr:AAA family ATPase [Candidatus Competibacterales bacterium]